MQRNITYQTEHLARYFTQHRVEWAQFYPSERSILERLHLERNLSVLDVGCGCGGLGLALRERFGVEKYSGVEINALAAGAGRALNPAARIFCGDILDISKNELAGQLFDVAVSLSCVDWNVQFSEMLRAAWSHVRPGGHLVSTFRLTREQGCDDIARSYQFINVDGVCEGERAPYVVLNATDLMVQLSSFQPSEIMASGYWGAPSATAVTPYEQLCFAAFAIRKRVHAADPTHVHLELPPEITEDMGMLREELAEE